MAHQIGPWGEFVYKAGGIAAGGISGAVAGGLLLSPFGPFGIALGAGVGATVGAAIGYVAADIYVDNHNQQVTDDQNHVHEPGTADDEAHRPDEPVSDIQEGDPDAWDVGSLSGFCADQCYDPSGAFVGHILYSFTSESDCMANCCEANPGTYGC